MHPVKPDWRGMMRPRAAGGRDCDGARLGVAAACSAAGDAVVSVAGARLLVNVESLYGAKVEWIHLKG